MQFVRNGPDVPERLLHAHEDGHVVFFCGAGISYPAKLPGFSGLVKGLFVHLGVSPSAVQQAAIKAGQFDTAIGLLEDDIVGGREAVRRALAAILTPDLNAWNATETHEALLTLGRTREGRTRLITTNFDRLFEEVIGAKQLSVERFHAPLLPVPKNRWDGLVYLHGLLSTAPTPSELDRLVVSSGDFGLAYLTERWAARFVSELFRNYTVCFVGYSINDPVLRYMMDALAADRLLGESPPEMFAFGSFSRGKEKERTNEWRTKNVTPILYREHNRHAYLHETLRAWADTYRDGVGGKERIVVDYAMAQPSASTYEDDFVGRLLWALSDPGGLPARRFADLDPPPSLDWLEPMTQKRYKSDDLERFGVASNAGTEKDFGFSLTRRPSPHTHSEWMALVNTGADVSSWDEVMYQMARWLSKHIGDPNLVLWLANEGGQLHPRFRSLIESRLDDAEAQEGDLNGNIGDTSLGLLIRTLWRLLLAGRLQSRAHTFDLDRWCDRFKRDSLCPTMRVTLREILTPRVSLRQPFRWPDMPEDSRDPRQLSDLVDWEIVLTTDHVHVSLAHLQREQKWLDALPELLTDFSLLLRDALDLMQELGGADDRNDPSWIHQPSISNHPQNRRFHDWTALIDLSRDAWLRKAETTPREARLVAETWWQVPYPVFRRLALFAAAQGTIIPARQALEWILSDNHRWLWADETLRETMRLLVALTPRLGFANKEKLEQAILAGPPLYMFKGDLDEGDWNRIAKRYIWLRLARMASTGTPLGAMAEERLKELSREHPDWVLAADQRDEFTSWIGEPDDFRRFVHTPRPRAELVQWLREHPEADPWRDDDWMLRCRNDFSTTACALCALASENVWPTDRWHQAFQAWSDDDVIKRSWRYMSGVILRAPPEVLRKLGNDISSWLKSVVKSLEGNESNFLVLAERILALDLEDGVETDDALMRAINHPVGKVTEAFLQWWFRRSLEDAEGLPDTIRPIFSALSDTSIDKFGHGRVILAAHAITLFRVDESWATQYLVPLFDWTVSELEARRAWQGFLWSPRLYRPFVAAIKGPFLETAGHYAALGRLGRQYAGLLTFAALDLRDAFTVPELARATSALPHEGLHESAQTLVRALEGAGDQRANYWTNRVNPYLKSIWPKSENVMTTDISESLAGVCVAAQEKFPEAFQVLRHWLQPLDYPHFLIHKISETNLCKRYPMQLLEFLDRIIGEGTHRVPPELATTLVAIKSTAPDLEARGEFRKLAEFVRRTGQDV